jgi:acetyltransferase-like isoleucine patch superfamily enzyme
MALTEKDKMLAGELYDASAPELQAEQAATQRWLARYNTLDMALSGRRALMVERLTAVGDGAVIRPPFHCDYGFNSSLGAGAFLNFNCVILDVVEVIIGDGAQIGPGTGGCRDEPARVSPPDARPVCRARVPCCDLAPGLDLSDPARSRDAGHGDERGGAKRR